MKYRVFIKVSAMYFKDVEAENKEEAFNMVNEDVPEILDVSEFKGEEIGIFSVEEVF